MPLTDSNTPEGGQPKLRPSCEDAKPPLDYFALVIGIDSYKNIRPKLAGAVADAKIFEKLLLEKLVWKDNTHWMGHIQMLCDGEATRSAIIEKMRALKDNEQIVKDKTAIIIYYAGHGGRATTPESWTDWPGTGGHIELICPVDAQSKAATNCGTASGPWVESIPDRTINYILQELSAAKGNNITLIFDCCHLAGMTRAANDDGTTVERSPVDTLTISAECDVDIVSLDRGDSIKRTYSSDEEHKGFCASWDTHVLLAACATDEKARERDGQGNFTRALLEVLERVPIVKLTYKSLIKSLIMPPNLRQTPHLDGKHINRCIFTLFEEAVADSMTDCDSLEGPDSTTLSLHAGLVHGVVIGSRYDIYDVTDLPKLVPLVTATVVSVNICTSKLTLLEQSPIGNKFTPTSGLDSIRTLRPVFEEKQDDKVKLIYPLRRADSPAKADICLEVVGGKILFSRGETNSFFNEESHHVTAMNPYNFFPTPRKLLPSHLPHQPPSDDINGIRQFLNHYFHFTYYMSMQSSVDLGCLVSIEMFQLKRDEKDNFHVVDGQNMLSNLHRQGYVKIPVATTGSLDKACSSNEAFRYGLTIQSKSEKKLYLHIFCFDPSTLDIDVVYSNTVAGNCLDKGSKVSFGLDNSMIQPIVFSLSEEQEVDVQCIKMFVTTEPVDLRCIVNTLVKATEKSRGLGTDHPATLEWASKVIPFLIMKVTQSQDVQTTRSISSWNSPSLGLSLCHWQLDTQLIGGNTDLCTVVF
ncbi:hypothetical protein EDD18DRAFT_1465017 [Armillaria luteobubalina]|uniref:Peptidase C14 caspase domain-containing protein n=1 Tax=Armillaria luteobubalina TaxID=153913 RepID=A0AA39PZZ3_9AGAR|nr:hypothetical protein EDD18DRAFT_1465017 [Armillaria luteobubalina]